MMGTMGYQARRCCRGRASRRPCALRHRFARPLQETYPFSNSLSEDMTAALGEIERKIDVVAEDMTASFKQQATYQLQFEKQIEARLDRKSVRVGKECRV